MECRSPLWAEWFHHSRWCCLWRCHLPIPSWVRWSRCTYFVQVLLCQCMVPVFSFLIHFLLPLLDRLWAIFFDTIIFFWFKSSTDRAWLARNSSNGDIAIGSDWWVLFWVSQNQYLLFWNCFGDLRFLDIFTARLCGAKTILGLWIFQFAVDDSVVPITSACSCLGMGSL